MKKLDENYILPKLYSNFEKFHDFENIVRTEKRVEFTGLAGSSLSVYLAAHLLSEGGCSIAVLADKESAAYFYNDLESLFGEAGMDADKKHVLFFPNSFKSSNNKTEQDRLNMLSRIEVLKRLSGSCKNTIIVSYPAAVAEKAVTPKDINSNCFTVREKSDVSVDEVYDFLAGNGYERVEFVLEPGQFSLRGSIFDIYSYNNEYPYRIEFLGDAVESIRTFNPVDQLSVKKVNSVNILPALTNDTLFHKKALFDSLPQNALVTLCDISLIVSQFDNFDADNENFVTKEDFIHSLINYKTLLYGMNSVFPDTKKIEFHIQPQLDINKNFEILLDHLLQSHEEGKTIFICSETATQITRIKRIIDEMLGGDQSIQCNYIELSLHQGFIDNDNLIVVLTDHQIFNRYHKFNIKDRFDRKQANAIQELQSLQPGDYVTHIDYGVGRFDGLEKITNNGVEIESLRIVYANNDLLYVNIHSLYKISKYSDGEGREPKLNRLGSTAWATLKTNAKKKVKDIAKDLIKLYSERKNTAGFAFSPDTYMQHELEASFMYEDTPDQVSATIDVKNDMEKNYPMERLICGDVGFGKTEIAVRAAFKAVADSKQVIVLVPTTILALQHFQTFSSRLKDFPVRIDYLNRFRSATQQKQIIEDVASGKIDILIGTHKVLNSKIHFKDLGLLIVDEEQKFGVSAKEKLKQMKVNIDTLTMTATPIPRTLQFSLMGARDLSILRTPPPNRQPVTTEVCTFDDKIIKDAIDYEINRGGQVFFVHNKVQNIEQVASMLNKLLPGISVAIAHGQMDGNSLEKVMVDFIDGKYDVLLCTKIIESGLDIPNVNTIIINEANYYGLSELHQLRGRVGRSNKKAFCYLISPPLSVLTEDARKRLKAISEFSDLGSGFNIALRDLDIRGAGNILGAEQSGFISDIGFEVYQKILNEALSELKSETATDESDSSEMFEAHEYAANCQVDTDIQALIPDGYISNLTERMRIYREINDLDTEEDFINFQTHITDRFGPLPQQISVLFEILKIKKVACKLGIEKIVFKNGIFKCYFLSSENQAFYSSATFGRILNYITNNPLKCRVGDKNSKMTLEFLKQKYEDNFSFKDVRNILQEILDKDDTQQ